MQAAGIEFQPIYYDEDVVEYRFTCSNGRFCGQAEAYLGHDDIRDLARGLKGFPSKPSESREFELGTFDPKCAGGGLRLCFSRLDSAGHCVVDLELRSDDRTAPGCFESVAMRIPVEPAAIDSFVSELTSIKLNAREKAFLRMAL